MSWLEIGYVLAMAAAVSVGFTGPQISIFFLADDTDHEVAGRRISLAGFLVACGLLWFSQ